MIIPQSSNGRYPRELTETERELLWYVLPVDRPGYRSVRDLIDGMVVIGQGRRGPGNLVLGSPGSVPDNGSPLRPVVAYGVVETERGEVSVTVREFAGDQIDIEIIFPGGKSATADPIEIRRWTYSTWKPRENSPSNGNPVREVSISGSAVLVISASERRIWLHVSGTGMNLLIPVTGFHEEVMRLERVRDPEVALRPESLFETLEGHTDETLRKAFFSYNRIHPKIREEEGLTEPKARKRGLLRFFSSGRSDA